MAMQQQQMAAQQAAGGPAAGPSGGGGGEPKQAQGGGDQEGPPGSGTDPNEQKEQPGSELSDGAQEVQDHLSKGEKSLSPEQMRIYLKQQKVVDETMAKWRRGARSALSDIMSKMRKN